VHIVTDYLGSLITEDDECTTEFRTSIKMWTGLPVEESVRMTEDRDKWRKYVGGVANPRIDEDG